MDIYDLMYGLNDVSDYLVIETEKKSPQLRERGIIKWTSLAACVCLVVAAALYSVYMRGGFGHITPAITVNGDTTAYVTEDTADAYRETNGPADTDETADIDNESKAPERAASKLTGDLTEYSFDYDKLEEILKPIEKEEGNYVDGMGLSVSVQPETYENGTVLAFVNFGIYEGYSSAAEGDFIYVVRISLDSDEYEYVDKFNEIEDACAAYGIPYLQSIYPYGYFEFSESDKYLLYRDSDTANLRLRDKTTGDVVTIHEWNSPDDGAARGFGIGDGGMLCADKYVFFTLVTPDREFYLELYSSVSDYDYDPSADHATVETNYVYDIETGELREFLNGYTFCAVGGNILYLCAEPEYSPDMPTGKKPRYLSVDLSGGLNENLSDEEFLNGIGSTTVRDMLSDDGRYMVLVDYTSVEGQLTFYSYDTVTKETKTAVATNEQLKYSDVMYHIVTPEGRFIVSCDLVADTETGGIRDIIDERVFVFDITSDQ